jgi:hypothetical protein
VDGAFLAARTDGALLLVDSQRTRQRQLVESVGRLEMAGATLVGVVLTRVSGPHGVATSRTRTWARTRTRRIRSGQGIPDPAG